MGYAEVCYTSQLYEGSLMKHFGTYSALDQGPSRRVLRLWGGGLWLWLGSLSWALGLGSLFGFSLAVL